MYTSCFLDESFIFFLRVYHPMRFVWWRYCVPVACLTLFVIFCTNNKHTDLHCTFLSSHFITFFAFFDCRYNSACTTVKITFWIFKPIFCCLLAFSRVFELINPDPQQHVTFPNVSNISIITYRHIHILSQFISDNT